ncbi:MAG: hypothetical protein Q8P28_00020 [Deltaproteobacteria bacterium]|nr:hypothetical protein [Deltaproteobacteria bacterium]
MFFLTPVNLSLLAILHILANSIIILEQFLIDLFIAGLIMATRLSIAFNTIPASWRLHSRCSMTYGS